MTMLRLHAFRLSSLLQQAGRACHPGGCGARPHWRLARRIRALRSRAFRPRCPRGPSRRRDRQSRTGNRPRAAAERRSAIPSAQQTVLEAAAPHPCSQLRSGGAAGRRTCACERAAAQIRAREHAVKPARAAPANVQDVPPWEDLLPEAYADSDLPPPRGRATATTRPTPPPRVRTGAISRARQSRVAVRAAGGGVPSRSAPSRGARARAATSPAAPTRMCPPPVAMPRRCLRSATGAA